MRTEEIKSWAVTNKAFLMAGIIVSATVLYLIFDVNYESCEDEENCLTIAFEVQDLSLIHI